MALYWWLQSIFPWRVRVGASSDKLAHVGQHTPPLVASRLAAKLCVKAHANGACSAVTAGSAVLGGTSRWRSVAQVPTMIRTVPSGLDNRGLPRPVPSPTCCCGTPALPAQESTNKQMVPRTATMHPGRRPRACVAARGMSWAHAAIGRHCQLHKLVLADLLPGLA
jgi:hypothetical protein